LLTLLRKGLKGHKLPFVHTSDLKKTEESCVESCGERVRGGMRGGGVKTKTTQ